MARTKTLSAPRPRTLGTRPRVTLRGGGKASVKRRNGDRRENPAEGRRASEVAATAPPEANTPDPRPDDQALPPASATPLSEEEQIESAKYLPRHAPPRVFEEERFLFPESYGIDRVRLLVKDPEWLFAYWDLSARAVEQLRRELGERGMALTRLTLRISDPGHGGTSVILLPYGARAWYVRADTATRSYRAHLGWTLPSGHFRALAESNLVSTPRTGAARTVARHRVRFDAPREEVRAALGGASESHPGPWRTEPFDAEAGLGAGRKRGRGGASDVFRR